MSCITGRSLVSADGGCVVTANVRVSPQLGHSERFVLQGVRFLLPDQKSLCYSTARNLNTSDFDLTLTA